MWPKHFNYAKKTSNVKNDKKIELDIDELLKKIDTGAVAPSTKGEERRVLNPPPPPPKKPKKY